MEMEILDFKWKNNFDAIITVKFYPYKTRRQWIFWKYKEPLPPYINRYRGAMAHWRDVIGGGQVCVLSALCDLLDEKWTVEKWKKDDLKHEADKSTKSNFY